MSTIYGGAGNDTLAGNDTAETIYGLGGNDSIEAAKGENVVYGGDGDDVLRASDHNDTFYGGSGNDSIQGESGDDLIFGGTGDDTIDGKEDEDTIYGGDGADSIDAGKQDDLVFAGSGDDFVDANEGNDTIFAGTGNDSILGGKHNALIYGGDGNDSIDGEAGHNTLYGGGGDDTIVTAGGDQTIFGGDGHDSIDTAGGDDTIGGGAGNDTIATYGGSDRIIFHDGDGDDVVTDFSKGNDSVEIKSWGIETFADVEARLTKVGGDSVLTLDDGSTLRLDGVKPNDLSASNFVIVPEPVCYCPGTLILTGRGEVAVEDLRVGDLLVTADAGARPLRWIGRTEHHWEPGPHKHKPIEIKAGSLGDALPRRTLIVSPQHHMLFAGPVVEDLFGTPEVLALAKALVGLDHVRAMNGKRQVTYYTLLCDRHEVIMAEGAWSESFYPGPTALRMIGPELRAEIEALVPALRTDPDHGYGPRARRVLSRRETEALVGALHEHGVCRQDDEIATRRRAADHAMWDEDLARETAAAAPHRLRLAG